MEWEGTLRATASSIVGGWWSGGVIRKRLAVVSLVLLVLTVALWIHSYIGGTVKRYVNVVGDGGRRYVTVASEQGLFGVEYWYSKVALYLNTTSKAVVFRRQIGRGRGRYRAYSSPDFQFLSATQVWARRQRLKWVNHPTPLGLETRVRFFSLIVERRRSWLGDTRLQMCVPLWVPTLLFSILPATALISHRLQRRRGAHGLCTQCGYDLRGNVSGRCPECGTSVKVDASSGQRARPED